MLGGGSLWVRYCMLTDPLAPYDLDRDDPRLDGSYVRRVAPEDGCGAVVLIGVVHDHPASVSRVRTIVEAVDPAVVGLELPPITIPAFTAYASDDAVPPERGGEFSAAIQAAPDARHVGIDGPSCHFFRELVSEAVTQRVSWPTIRRVGRSLLSISQDSLRHRLASAVTRHTPYDVHVDRSLTHACTLADDPRRQATDERRQIARSYSLLRAATPPEPIRLRDAAREACMVRRLRSLRREGTVVTVVGLDHLERIATDLDATI